MKLIRQYLFGCLLSLLVCLTIAGPSWAALSYVGGQAGGFAGTTSPQVITFSLTNGTDATPQVGDLVVVCYGVGSASDRTLIIDNPSGTDYTLVGSELYVNDTEDPNLRMAYRVMPDPTEADVTLSAVGGGTGAVTDAGAYTIQVFRGVHATPLEQAAVQGTGTDTILVNPGNITPTTAGTVVVLCGNGASTNTSAHFGSSDLTDFRLGRADDGHATNIGAGYFAWASGQFSPATWTYGASDNVNFAYAWSMIGLAPAVAPVTAVDAGNAGAIMLLLGR